MVGKAIVLADGPAALLRVANRPLAAHALSALADAGVTRTLVAGAPALRGELDRELRQSRAGPPGVSYLEQDAHDGLPATLSELERFIAGDPFVLHLGDSLDRESLQSLLQIPTKELDSTVLVQDAVHDDCVVGPHPPTSSDNIAPVRAEPGPLRTARPRRSRPAGRGLAPGRRCTECDSQP